MRTYHWHIAFAALLIGSLAGAICLIGFIVLIPFQTTNADRIAGVALAIASFAICIICSTHLKHARLQIKRERAHRSQRMHSLFRNPPD